MNCISRAMMVAGLVLLCGCARGGRADGRWVVDSVSGAAVPSQNWWIDVANSEIIAGKDGCNEWRYQDPNSPIVMSAAQECPPDPAHDAYWRVVKQNRSGKVTGGDRMVLKAGADQMTIHKASSK